MTVLPGRFMSKRRPRRLEIKKTTTCSPDSALSDTSLRQTTFAFNFAAWFAFATGMIANKDRD